MFASSNKGQVSICITTRMGDCRRALSDELRQTFTSLKHKHLVESFSRVDFGSIRPTRNRVGIQSGQPRSFRQSLVASWLNLCKSNLDALRAACAASRPPGDAGGPGWKLRGRLRARPGLLRGSPRNNAGPPGVSA